MSDFPCISLTGKLQSNIRIFLCKQRRISQNQESEYFPPLLLVQYAFQLIQNDAVTKYMNSCCILIFHTTV